MGGAIGNEGFDIVFYLALMVPLEYLLTSRRVVADGNRRKAAMIAGGVLAAVSAVKLGLEMTHKAPSYYDKLEVMPTANHAEIKKGYRAAAQKVHPDKLQAAGEDEDGDEAFVELKKAYDVLTDSALRDLYQKFGPDGLEYQTDTSKLMAGLGFFYVVWLAAAYLLTRRKAVGASQTWTFTGLLALAEPGSEMQIQIALTAAVGFFTLQALFQPFREAKLNAIATLVSFSLVFTFLIAALLPTEKHAATLPRADTSIIITAFITSLGVAVPSRAPEQTSSRTATRPRGSSRARRHCPTRARAPPQPTCRSQTRCGPPAE